jgi:hypothetical protein
LKMPKSFASLKSKATQLRKRAVKTKNKVSRGIEKRRAEGIQKRAQAEITEAARLDDRLAALKRQQSKLKKQESIQRKQREIKRLEERVTVKGQILKKINDSLSNLDKQIRKAERRR